MHEQTERSSSCGRYTILYTLSYSDSFLNTAENGRVKDALLRKLPRLGLQRVLSSGLREHARVAMPLLAVAIRSKLTLV